MAEERRFNVFISHSSQDREWVSEFASSLRAAGVDAWFDESQLTPGDRIGERIEEALRQSQTLILITSPQTLRSPWTFFELGAAVADGKRIIPVLTGGVSPEDVPVPIAQYQYLREPSPQQAGQRVADVLAKLDAA